MRNTALLILVLTLNSCISNHYLKKIYKKAHKEAGMQGISTINHTYKNLDSTKSYQLSGFLGESNSRKWDREKNKLSDSAQIGLNYDGKKHIWVSVHSKDSIKPYKLKVKNKGKYLSVKRKLQILPIPFCYFVWDYKQILFNDNQGRLVSVSRRMSAGWVLFMVAGNESDNISVYEVVR